MRVSTTACLLATCLCLAVAAPVNRRDADTDATSGDSARQEKSLVYYQYLQPPYGAEPDYDMEEGALSRAEPGGRRKGVQFPDSPIYYIRLPPSPYVFVPGLGYVSQPQPGPPQMNPFINLPLEFVSNGKPTSVYPWPQPPPPPRPVEESSVTSLDKGPYVFNGRPTDVYVLRDSYNALYSDALQNFYP